MEPTEQSLILTIQYAKEHNKKLNYKRALTPAYLYGLRAIVAQQYKVPIPDDIIHYSWYKAQLDMIALEGKVNKRPRNILTLKNNNLAPRHSWVYDIPAEIQIPSK